MAVTWRLVSQWRSALSLRQEIKPGSRRSNLLDRLGTAVRVRQCWLQCWLSCWLVQSVTPRPGLTTEAVSQSTGCESLGCSIPECGQSGASLAGCAQLPQHSKVGSRARMRNSHLSARSASALAAHLGGPTRCGGRWQEKCGARPTPSPGLQPLDATAEGAF